MRQLYFFSLFCFSFSPRVGKNNALEHPHEQQQQHHEGGRSAGRGRRSRRFSAVDRWDRGGSRRVVTVHFPPGGIGGSGGGGRGGGGGGGGAWDPTLPAVRDGSSLLGNGKIVFGAAWMLSLALVVSLPRGRRSVFFPSSDTKRQRRPITSRSARHVQATRESSGAVRTCFDCSGRRYWSALLLVVFSRVMPADQRSTSIWNLGRE